MEDAITEKILKAMSDDGDDVSLSKFELLTVASVVFQAGAFAQREYKSDMDRSRDETNYTHEIGEASHKFARDLFGSG